MRYKGGENWEMKIHIHFMKNSLANIIVITAKLFHSPLLALLRIPSHLDNLRIRHVARSLLVISKIWCRIIYQSFLMHASVFLRWSPSTKLAEHCLSAVIGREFYKAHVKRHFFAFFAGFWRFSMCKWRFGTV